MFRIVLFCLYTDELSLRLETPDKYRYLNTTGVYTITGTDDVSDYAVTMVRICTCISNYLYHDLGWSSLGKQTEFEMQLHYSNK